MTAAAPPGRPRWRAHAATLGVFALARAVAAWALGPVRPIADDQRDYLRLRDTWLALGRFADPSTHAATAFRDPGYPLFLTMLARVAGPGLGALWLAQTLLGAGAGACLVEATRRAAGEAAARAACALFLLDFVFAGYSFLVYPEVLTAALAAAALLALAAPSGPPARAGAIGGGLVGAAGLVRAAAAPALAGVACAGRGPHAVRRAMLVLAVAAVPLLAWGLRNRAEVGQFGLNTNAAVNFVLGNGAHTPLPHPYLAMADSLTIGGLPGRADEAARARAAQRAAWGYVARHPARCLALAGAKILDALGPDRMLLGLAWRGQFPARPPGVVVGFALAGLVLSFPLRALALAACFSPGDSAVARGGRIGFALTLAMQALTLGHSRFTLLAWLLLVPGAAVLLVRARGGEPVARRAIGLGGLSLALAWAWQLR